MTTRKCVLGLLSLGVVLGTAFVVLRTPNAHEYRRFQSPYGRFEVVVFRIPVDFSMLGGSGDAPGYFQLLDKRMDKVVREQEVEMVQNVDHVEWTASNVSVKLLADWSLPL